MPKFKLGYIENGVLVTPDTFSIGDTVKLTYHGDLAKRGASEVFAHIGYGESEWKNVTSIKMSKTRKGFEAKLPVISNSKLNIVFKDDSDSWDNNSGNNYSLKTTPKYSYDCIKISPSDFSIGDTITLTYNGILFENGSDEVYAHMGYGSDWENANDLQMAKTDNGFELKLKVDSPSSLNIVFRDSLDNWDNNCQKNYTIY